MSRALALALVLAGEALLFSAPAPLFFGGQALRLAGAVALAYGVASYRLFDVRTRVQRNLAVLLIALLSAIPITVVLVGIQQLAASGGQPYVALLTFFLVVLTFVLYQPFRQLLETVVFRFFLGDEFDTSRVVRRYSQAIARTLDVNELSLVIIDTIGWLLDTGRGALLVVTNDSQGALVEPIPALGDVPSAAQRFAPDDPFISALTQGHEPVLQYDLDFRPTFQALPAAERAWLTALATELFVPVIDRDQLVGIIALGPRRSGLTYRPNEIELLQTLADQTVVALQNARLYSELNTQNERIRRLNRDLQRQYDRLELIDRAKSDFIAIASHELRAPLTQLKGYADILDAMNEENMLTREQTRAIIGHVNRATTQLENLVSAMLDASQLEAESMPLTLMPTALETILRLAVDPLVPVMRERRLKYRTPGITDLPVLKVDFKRMVQAFRSLIGNAVKYTPDGGEITVSADLVASSNGRLDHVEIVVADSGIGIEPQYQELIFEKFFRIDDEQLPSGTSGTYLGAGPGLGLPITRGVIEAHGGRIWVESPGENSQHLPGSRFHIVLPLDPGPSPDGPQPETNLARAGG